MIEKLRALASQTLRLLTLVGAMGAAGMAAAQTSMVNCGTNAAGSVVYLEVYEYDYVMEKPSFPGGEEKMIKFINRTRVYPESAYRKGVQGRVLCSFVVMPDGSISNVRILRGVEHSLNCEAKRVLAKMPAWTPGKMYGRPVPVKVIYPITFRR